MAARRKAPQRSGNTRTATDPHGRRPGERRDATTGQRQAHSRGSHKPSGVFDRRGYTHTPTDDGERGENVWRRELSDHERSLPGVAEAAAEVDAAPHLGPDHVTAAYLAARAAIVPWRTPEDIVTTVARGELVERERRAARDRQRGRDVARARAEARARAAWREASAALPREHVTLEEAKRLARERRAAQARGERETVQQASQRAVRRVRVRKP